jgi:hypothetical protein
MLQLLVVQLIHKFICPVSVGAGGTETLNLPEDGILYAGRNGVSVIDAYWCNSKY